MRSKTGSGPAGRKKITIQLTGKQAHTELSALHENLPPGVSPADNEKGWHKALDKLTALAEQL